MKGFIELTDSDGQMWLLRADMFASARVVARDGGTCVRTTDGDFTTVAETPGEIAALLEAAEEQSATATGLDPLAIDVLGEVAELVESVATARESGTEPHPEDLRALMVIRRLVGVSSKTQPGTFEWVLAGLREDPAQEFRRGSWSADYDPVSGKELRYTFAVQDTLATDWQEVPAEGAAA